MLTGCRKSEILTLQWRSYREGRLYLPDSKTGPRTVWLCKGARGVLDRLPWSSGWVFPVSGLRTPWLWLDPFWRSVREDAGLRDVRLHDTRRTVASQAIAWGVPLSTVARMLGHTDPAMTLRYAHVGDRDLQAAAERIGKAIKAATETGGRQLKSRPEGTCVGQGFDVHDREISMHVMLDTVLE